MKLIPIIDTIFPSMGQKQSVNFSFARMKKASVNFVDISLYLKGWTQ